VEGVLTVEGCALLHSLFAEDGRYLNHGFNVVRGVEEGEAAGENCEEDYAGGPYINFCHTLVLLCLEKNVQADLWFDWYT